MNAACALQHFCDIHGPQILLCTEIQTYVRDINSHDHEDLKLFYSQCIQSENAHGKLECKSCTLSSEPILISTLDHFNRMLFISSVSPPNKELFKNVRNACVRSLNIEKSAGNDCPILFGDEESGYCVSLTFSCKDFYARGSQRLYSLCYLSSDKYHLLSLMNVISDCMKQIVYWIQNDANQTFEHEGHIRINTNFNGLSTQATYVLRPPPRTPTQRMLSEMVHDSKLIYRVHALFVWLLRTVQSSIRETLFHALPTEEQTTEQERKDISQHLILKRRSRTVVDTSITIDTSLHPVGSMNDDDDDDYDSLQYRFSSYGDVALRIFRYFISKLNHREQLLYHWVIGNQLIIKYSNHTEDPDLIRALVSVFRLFLPDGCFDLVEATDLNLSYTANLVLIDIADPMVTLNPTEDPNTVVIAIVFDESEEHIHLAHLETTPLNQSEPFLSAYVKSLMEILIDTSLDVDAFEAMIIQQKFKYLNKAKIYFQLGRCQIASVLLGKEREQMDVLHLHHRADLLMIRFWQKGLSQIYKSQIRMLKQNANQEKQQNKT